MMNIPPSSSSSSASAGSVPSSSSSSSSSSVASHTSSSSSSSSSAPSSGNIPILPLPFSNASEFPAPPPLGASVFGLPADALAQVLNVPPSHAPISRGPPSSSSSASSSSSQHTDPQHRDGGANIAPISFPMSEFFHNSQAFKGFPENIFPYISSTPPNRTEEAPRNNVPLVTPMDYARYLRWGAPADDTHKPNVPKQTRPGGEQVPPLALSPTGTRMQVNNDNSPYIASSINAQGIMLDEDSKSDTDLSPRDDTKAHEGIHGDDKAQKKKRRQEKNREAAQLFRQRQKAKVHELERSVSELTCNNSEYRMKMEILAFENKILKDQLIYLKNLVSSGIVITGPPSTAFPSLTVAPDPEKAEAALTAAIGGPGNPMAIPCSHLGMPAHMLGVDVGAPVNGGTSPLRPSPIPMLTPKTAIPVSNLQHTPNMDDNYVVHL